MTFMKNPTAAFRRYIKSTGTVDELGFSLGRMAMALEIITQIKCLEEIRVMDEASKAEAVTALETLLQDCGLYDVAYEMYDRLSVWRVPSFHPEPSSQPVLEREGSVFSVGPDDPRLPVSLSGSSSELSSPRARILRDSRPPSSPEEHHGQELVPWPTSLLEGPSSGEALRTRIESGRSEPDKAS